MYIIIHIYNIELTGERGMDLNVGDTIKLKKPHPCGSSEWEILRTGMDFRLKCKGCGHQIMVTRKLVEKNIKPAKKPLDK
jgi:hypothetical protein